MTSNHHGPYGLGYTRATMAITKSGNMVTWSESQWAATRPHEVGVASNPESACRGECVPGSCTHRPSSHGSWECPKSVS